MTQDVLDTPRAGFLVIRGSAIRIGGYVAGSALSVVSAALLTRHLGPGDFGRYGAVFALVTIVGAITDAGMTTLGVREFAVRGSRERDRLMRELLGLRLAITGAGIGVAVLFTIVVGYDHAMVAGTALAGAGLLLSVVATTLTVPLQAMLALGRVSALDLLRQVATTAALVALVLAGAGIVPLLAVPIPVGLLVAFATGVLVRRQVSLRVRIDLRAWRGLLAETASFALATAIGTLYVYMAIVVLSIVSSDAETGYFNASFRIFTVVVAIAGLIVTSAFPVLARAARDDEARMAYATQRLFDVAVLAGAFFALATVVGARVGIQIVAGLPGFEGAVGVLRVQGLAMLASFVLAPWGFALISLRRHTTLLVANAIALTASLILTLALAPDHGALGAAWATLAGETALATVYGVGLVRHRPALRPRCRVALWALGAALLGLAVGMLTPGVSDTLATLLALAVYVAVVVASGAVPIELRDAVRQLRARAG
jgi:O-antigen/teichoic acid export membrane protein